jgi:hypothetical protein
LKIVKPLTHPGEPRSLAFILEFTCERELEFSVKLRLPWWLSGKPVITIAGQQLDIQAAPSTLIRLHRGWRGGDTIYVELPKALTACSLPDKPEMAAFMDGPVVLAGLIDGEYTFMGDRERPETILSPVHELEWYRWRQGYRTRIQPYGTRFIPLYEVRDERYTVYFSVI